MIKLKTLHGALLCASPVCEEAISRVLTVENCAQASPAKVGKERESWCPVFRAFWIFHCLGCRPSPLPWTWSPDEGERNIGESHSFASALSKLLLYPVMFHKPKDVHECLLVILKTSGLRLRNRDNRGVHIAQGAPVSSTPGDRSHQERVAPGLAVVGTAREPNHITLSPEHSGQWPAHSRALITCCLE